MICFSKMHLVLYVLYMLEVERSVSVHQTLPLSGIVPIILVFASLNLYGSSTGWILELFI